MKVVYIVLKNADMVEGRGPMLFDSVWCDPDQAITYVSDQQGIFGGPQNVTRGLYGHYAYGNGFIIEEVVMYETYKEKLSVNNAELKKSALAKLSLEEKIALGL